jgi:hypothetical protein
MSSRSKEPPSPEGHPRYVADGAHRQGVIVGVSVLPVYLLLSWLLGGEGPWLAHLFRAALAATATGLGAAAFGLRLSPGRNRRRRTSRSGR